MSLTWLSRSGKHGRLGHLIRTREMPRGRLLRSIHSIWLVTVGNSSRFFVVLISMLGRVKNSHYSRWLSKTAKTLLIMTSFTEKHFMTYRKYRYPFLICSPLLCQHVVSLGLKKVREQQKRLKLECERYIKDLSLCGTTDRKLNGSLSKIKFTAEEI